MAILDVTAAAEALKIDYLPGLRYQLNAATPVLAVLERDTESVVGGEIRMALRYGRQGGTGARADSGDLPTPNSRKTKQAAWQTKNIFARIQISDKTMKASRSNVGAFANLLEADLDDAMTDAKDMVSRMVFGDGTGNLATCAVNTATNTLSLSSVQFLSEGQFIDILNSSNVVTVAARQITAVDEVASTITIDGAAVTTAATDYIVQAGNYNMELTGLGAVFTAGSTLYGIPRATNTWFNPTIIAVNGEISEVTLQKAIDEAERKAGGAINFWASSYGVRRAYQNLLTATKQLANTMELKGGFTVLTYNGKPFTADKYAPAGVLHGLDLTTWRLYQLADWGWLDEDGAVLSRVSGKAVWEATLAMYADLGCSKPRGNVKLTGVTEH